MATIRRKKRDTPFVQIDKSALQDKSLSWKAKGLLAYLLSLPDDWKVFQSEIVTHATDGKDSTRSAFEELIAAGYIQKEIAEKKKGRFTGYNYTVSEFPQRLNRSGETENGKPATTNKDNTNKDNTNKGKSENLPDRFKDIEGLKSKIGPAHYKHLNEVCEDEDVYNRLRGMYLDGRFNSLMDWLEYKKDLRKTYRAKASVTKLINEFSKFTPREIEKALSEAIGNGYAGIFPKRLPDPTQKARSGGVFSNLKAKRA